MTEGVRVGQAAYTGYNNEQAPARGTGRSDWNLLRGRVTQSIVGRKRAQPLPRPVTERVIKANDGSIQILSSEAKPEQACSENRRQSEAVNDLNISIQQVAEEVRKGNYGNFKKEKECYREAVAQLHSALSQATRANITSRSPESSFTGNLRVDSRYPPLYRLLEIKHPDWISALSDLRELVYFLDQEDQEKICNELVNKLEEPSETILE